MRPPVYNKRLNANYDTCPFLFLPLSSMPVGILLFLPPFFLQLYKPFSNLPMSLCLLPSFLLLPILSTSLALAEQNFPSIFSCFLSYLCSTKCLSPMHSWAHRKLSMLSPLNILLSINGPLLSFGFSKLYN